MDKDYWEDFYLKHGRDLGLEKQSSFATFCHNFFLNSKKKHIVELGSGNGRDSIYFAKHGYKVSAIDQSTTAIINEKDKNHAGIYSNLTTISDDFIKYDFSSIEPIDVFYSRFTLHAISKNDENILLPKVFKSLLTGGIFCIEVRTIKDSLYGKGEDYGDNAYKTDHYRRFIDSQKFLKLMFSYGFELLFFTESNNLSIYKEDNPVLMRVILEKI